LWYLIAPVSFTNSQRCLIWHLFGGSIFIFFMVKIPYNKSVKFALRAGRSASLRAPYLGR